MRDEDLDDLLRAPVAALPSSLEHEARVLAAVTRPGRRARRRIVWAVATAVVLAAGLTAGITQASATLSRWPWVELPQGSERTTAPIPIDWVTVDGFAESCRGYLEFSGLDPAELARVDAAIRERDWTGFGQRLYDSGVEEPDDPTGQSRASTHLSAAMNAFAAEVLPHVTWGEPTGPRIDAVGFSCRDDNPR